MQLIYYAHSYREADAVVVEFFLGLMRSEGLIPSLDPPSASLNSAKPERHLNSTDGMVAVLTARENGVSQYILYEISLCLRAQKPILVFVEDVLPDDIVPSRILQRRFSRRALLRQVRDHRHAIRIFRSYIGDDPPPRYQPHLKRRSCIIAGTDEIPRHIVDGLLQTVEELNYRALEVVTGTHARVYESSELELMASVDLALCFVSSADTYSHYIFGAFRAFLTPSILISGDHSYPFHPLVPLEYQPRLASLDNIQQLQELLRREIAIFEEEYVDLNDQSEVKRYAQLLIQEASPTGTYSDEARQIFVKELVMGDKYQAGQAGAMGPHSTASHMNFSQLWTSTANTLDINVLAKELSILRDAMKRESSVPEHDEAVGEIAKAERAAKDGNGPKALEKLSAAGKWAFDVATKIGTTVAAAAIKFSLGL
jgi:hypothetical protein